MLRWSPLSLGGSTESAVKRAWMPNQFWCSRVILLFLLQWSWRLYKVSHYTKKKKKTFLIGCFQAHLANKSRKDLIHLVFLFIFFIIIVSTCYWHNSVARSVFQFRTTLGPVLSQRWDGSQLSFVQLLTSCRGWILKSLIPRPLLELNYEVEILCLNTLQRNLAHIFMVPKVIL